MRVRDREGRGGKRRKNGSELREARNMFYSWEFCMRHDLSMIYHSPAPALALYYFLSLNHLLFPHFSHSRSGATFSLGLLLLCWPQREVNHQCWNGSSDGFWVTCTMWWIWIWRWRHGHLLFSCLKLYSARLFSKWSALEKQETMRIINMLGTGASEMFYLSTFSLKSIVN